MRSTHSDKPSHQSAWAERLAQRLPVSWSTSKAARRPAARAVAVLLASFDRALAQANQALARAARNERIVVDHQDHCHQYSLTASFQAPRSISIFVSLKEEDNKVVGGALISTSQSAALMYLVPTYRDKVQWMFQSAQVLLTPRIIDDLFLLVFSDDPAALARLSPLCGLDLFTSED